MDILEMLDKICCPNRKVKIQFITVDSNTLLTDSVKSNLSFVLVKRFFTYTYSFNTLNFTIDNTSWFLSTWKNSTKTPYNKTP